MSIRIKFINYRIYISIFYRKFYVFLQNEKQMWFKQLTYALTVRISVKCNELILKFIIFANWNHWKYYIRSVVVWFENLGLMMDHTLTTASSARDVEASAPICTIYQLAKTCSIVSNGWSTKTDRDNEIVIMVTLPQTLGQSSLLL